MADPLFKNNTMNTPTIEDVLNKHRVFTAGKEALERVIAAMTEYASLNRQGWTEGFNWKEEYDQAVNEIGQLQEQLKEAENEIRSLQSELNSR